MLAVNQIKIIFHPNVKKIKNIVRQVIFKTLHPLFYIILNRSYSWFICGWISCLSVFSVLRVLSCRCTMPPVGSMNVCRPYYTKTSLEPWSSLSLMMQALWVCLHIWTGGRRNVFRSVWTLCLSVSFRMTPGEWWMVGGRGWRRRASQWWSLATALHNPEEVSVLAPSRCWSTTHAPDLIILGNKASAGHSL